LRSGAKRALLALFIVGFFDLDGLGFSSKPDDVGGEL
jgi:hypothetical protein